MYQVSLDDVGTVEGGEHLLPVAGEHDWRTPYPAFDAVLPLRWRRGSLRKRPDVYWYPPLRHWVSRIERAGGGWVELPPL